MKRIYTALALAAIAACTPEEDIRVTTKGPEPITIECSGDVVLKKSDNPFLALTVNWTDNNDIATLGNGKAPRNATVNNLQFSASEDFAIFQQVLTATGSTSAQFTVESLNVITGKLGMEGGVKAPLYIRMASSLGTNVKPTYSNVVSILVTPYHVDMSVGHILDKNHEDTGATLPVVADGVYQGFMAASSWFNWFLQEGDGTEWGNLGQDGKPFFISSASDKWNMWFPEPGGSYYVTVDTGKGEWSALYLPTVTVSGDITGEMTFNKAANQWTIAYNAAGAGSVSVTLSGTGKKYDTTTGDSSSNDSTFGFGGSADAVTFGSSAAAIQVAVPAAGEQFLVLDLGTMKLSCGNGAAPAPTASQYLYAVGVDDGITNADWNFDNYLVLYDEDNISYAGACNVNSKWGYRFYTVKDDWSEYYGFAEGDAAAGTLEKNKDSNVPAPEAGLYLLKASLGKLTYSALKVGKVQIAGVNDDWTLQEMEAGSAAGIYSKSIDVTAATPWGFKIYFDDNWDEWFGGSEGSLTYGSKTEKDTPGAPVDDSLIGSTCIFTVDLCKGTYTIEKQ